MHNLTPAGYAVVGAIALFFLYKWISTAQKHKEQITKFAKDRASIVKEASDSVGKLAQQMFTAWRSEHLEREVTRRTKEVEKEVRSDAIKRSKATIIGLVNEQLAPFLPDFKYDGKDCRFLGSPVDFVCFTPEAVVFVEVKTGNSKQTPREKEVQALVDKRQVRYEVLKI